MSLKSFAKSNFTSKMLMTVGVPFAAVASIAGIAVGSNAAFISSTDTGSNVWTSGTVKLTNDKAATAVFAPTKIVPGYTETHCVTVSSSSDVPTKVKMYSGSYTTNILSEDLKFDIQVGSGGTNVDGVDGAPGSCSGFLPDATDAALFSGTAKVFMTAHNTGGTGLGSVVLAPGATKTYQITATLPPEAKNMGSSTSTAFQWVAQSS
jgi:hypothetical protein